MALLCVAIIESLLWSQQSYIVSLLSMLISILLPLIRKVLPCPWPLLPTWPAPSGRERRPHSAGKAYRQWTIASTCSHSDAVHGRIQYFHFDHDFEFCTTYKKKFSSTLRQETGSAPDFMHEIRKLVSQWRFLRFKQFPNLQGHVLCLKSKI